MEFLDKDLNSLFWLQDPPPPPPLIKALAENFFSIILTQPGVKC